ncbi:sigma-70 family RNA polymerase sigma factor [Aurantiacibacter poecillastricola]|uniref:sigma-70 family RNA polymerase sigma factor n=1 Tax=Aurantiacibacter poecillastricola TaxID=3064385 RepID=UPI00273E0F66|nr:sigma-70 family RNA polymerase sigma factor [Aurantiacibacter sp. 219JJ12-13]MDP5261835.1 sigma-70 family RNA polymerase sigma factor [Aurantiacibacter sp. 219JJ12-13]
MDQQANTLGDPLDRLMAAARGGNSAAYRRFLAEAAQRIRARLSRKMGADSELEDLVQESLIAIHEKRHTLDPGRPVAPWMFAIANYKLIDHWRKRGRNIVDLDTDADMAIGSESFAATDIEALLEKLPEAQAAAIRMTHIEGLTNREAGERTGVGVSAMKLRVHRGMLRLKDIADEDRLND